MWTWRSRALISSCRRRVWATFHYVACCWSTAPLFLTKQPPGRVRGVLSPHKPWWFIPFPCARGPFGSIWHVSEHAGEMRLQFAQEHEDIRRWVLGWACHREHGARYFQEMSEEKEDSAERTTRSVEVSRVQSCMVVSTFSTSLKQVET